MKPIQLVLTLVFAPGVLCLAGEPAARLGDQTGHGGIIVGGSPTVLINGAPAARQGDLQTCPASTNVVPHVGGPIAGGSATVLINGKPAATIGSITICNGPPSVIVTGAPTVLIGGN